MKTKFKNSFITFVFTGFVILILGILALFLHHPLIFPSLGPTAFLMFTNPRSRYASPRNTVLGHLIGVTSGFVALFIFGLTDVPAIIISGISLHFIAAAALSLALTSFFMILFSAEHPPAGATTLIVSLGIMHTIPDLVVLMIAVVLLCVLAWIINNLNGIQYPIWRSEEINPK